MTPPATTVPSAVAPAGAAPGALPVPGPAAFARILRLLGGGLIRAEAQPFRILEWTAGALPLGDARVMETGRPPEAPPAWESLIYPPDLPLFQETLHQFLRGDQPAGLEPIEYRLIVRDGELLWLRHSWLEQEADGRVVTALVRVVSEEKRLQWEIMRTSETERSRVGQEIHDDLCQILAGLNYLTHLLHQRLKPIVPEEAAELERINHEIQAGLERTRALAHGLLPAKSDFNSLTQALQDLARQVATRFGLQLTVKLPAQPPAYSRECLLHLYRIVQEASSNSFKHGRATHLAVTLDERVDGHVLTIEDNGPGLPLDSVRVEGVGLNVMRNRAQLLGGTIAFHNSPRGGAMIQLHLPSNSDAQLPNTRSSSR